MPATEYVVYCYGVEFTGDYYTVTTKRELHRCETPLLRGWRVSTSMLECTVEAYNNVAVTRGWLRWAILCICCRRHEPGYVIRATSSASCLSICATISLQCSADMSMATVGACVFCLRGATDLSHRLTPNTNYMVSVFAERRPGACDVFRPVIEHISTRVRCSSPI